ncbi:flavin reductase family protein [Aquabacter spiritensis]|uniref:Flavin reductase (DIM6/NTAB) family NADH-FMN oxidoreductase RutF n=1 Tax=Aquabacter spiritensis TaxID=933073 RepID=A0A4V2UX00_9HYPH|nr:flavin reductase family protein [Aquabacter spiritensis]TCT01658.1 flavin reductase (DIM6/NTAB) family NADH-FMN oxidoreductase RutF [Aquabacter spiritensis]
MIRPHARRHMELAPADAAAFKSAMRHLAAGVAVITSRTEALLNGMTATAVCSVSAEPPRVLVVVNRQNTSHGIIARSAAFAVNILAADQDDLAAGFAQRCAEPFRDVGHGFGAATDCPVLHGAIAVLECRLAESHAAGTHTIFVGDVVHAHVAPREPLVYFDGRFRRLAHDTPPVGP